jgi:pimeloyl-ACP methyl ester carboxylesterase
MSVIGGASTARERSSIGGVGPTEDEVVPFRTGDGAPCNVIHVRGQKRPDKGPVLLVHGAGVRANIFRPPIQTNIVQYLLGLGFDVWLENWRASIDLPPRRWTLDDAAVYDHPAAVATVVERTGAKTIKAVIHCQGSTSFTMSAFAGLIPQVDTIVSNAVSLHTVVPRLSGWKLRYAVPGVSLATSYLNPKWGLSADTIVAKALSAFVSWSHHECDNPVCKWASFTYGSGFPTLWRHENLDCLTHAWIEQEFGMVPFTFFRQMGRCVRHGALESTGKHRQLPRDFSAEPPRTDARFALIAGQLNECFLPEGQRRTKEFLDRHRPGKHSLHVVPGYGHLDIFLGRNAVHEVYPIIARELLAAA